MALQLLEKDIHEKQDSLVALRKQLEELKAANIKMQSQMKVDHIPSSILSLSLSLSLPPPSLSPHFMYCYSHRLPMTLTSVIL